MSISPYIDSYLRESDTEAKDNCHPGWLCNFFSKFHSSLDSKTKSDLSAGDRQFVASAFSSALGCLLPPLVTAKREVPLANFLSPKVDGELKNLLGAKRIDFLLQNGSKLLFIEFKSNVQFNDVAAVMVEMAAVKKFSVTPKGGRIFTGSVHLFPYTTNVAGMKELNISLGSPLDFIWVLCKRGPLPKFDIEAIRKLNEEIEKYLG